MGEPLINGYLPLRDGVYETLRQKILKGELEPGARLIECDLADELGVSRTPVREAVHRLEQEGLVNILPRRGAHVANISEKTVRDVLEVRKALEELAVGLAIDRSTQEDRRLLREAEAVFAEASLGSDLRQIASADEAFHDVIYHATHNQKLELLISNLREQMYRFRFEYIKDEHTRSRLRDEHHEISEAIIRGYREVGQRVIGIHIDNQRDNIITRLQIEQEAREAQEQPKGRRGRRKKGEE